MWPPEVQQQKVMWPLRFEFDLGSLVPPTRWAEERILFNEISRARLQSGFFELMEPLAQQLLSRFPSTFTAQPYTHSYTHDDVQRTLVEIGQIQRFVAEPEYRMGNERLDVVWRKMVQSVPTFAFEVQVGGDVYHALGKLKHARELWNTRVFLVGDQTQFGARADQLLSSTFHEIRNELRMIDLHDLNRLHELKREVRETEEKLYLV